MLRHPHYWQPRRKFAKNEYDAYNFVKAEEMHMHRAEFVGDAEGRGWDPGHWG